MGKIDERFAALEGFIEELSINADQSKKSKETAEKFMATIGNNIQLESPENFTIYITSLKESLSSDLQYFRDTTKIIRIVSPKTANYIESLILEFEKYYLNFIKNVEELSKKDKTFFKNEEQMISYTKKILPIFDKIAELGTKIPHEIELMYNLFQDTLEFLRKE